MADAATKPITELALSAAWHDGLVAFPLHTTDGRSVEVVHRGHWSHGLGPDFRDAMIVLDGRELITGSVELHLATGAWREHGHHLDPRYDEVVLHAVLRHDGAETRRRDGALVPVVVLPLDPAMLRLFDGRALDWGRVGGATCAEELSRSAPNEVRAILKRLGDRRLATKSARIEARLTGRPPGEVLYQEIWDGLGFAANREAMGLLAGRLSLAEIERALATVASDERLHLARGLIFGAAGFLPLSPSEAALAGLALDDVAAAERWWRERGAPWREEALPATAWTRAHVRPANHPARRLAAGAALIANARGGLLAALLDPLRKGTDPVIAIRELATWGGDCAIGADRARGIVVNGLIPFAAALAQQTEDSTLADAASAAWDALPAAESNEITRRALTQVAGNARLTGLGARGQQGLIYLDTILCGPRRCYECPVAHRVLE